MTALQVEEFYVIVWEAKKEQIFEMPTGGAAMMRQGPNLLKLARKEQCLALLQQLRNKFRTDGQIHRVFPSECGFRSACCGLLAPGRSIQPRWLSRQGRGVRAAGVTTQQPMQLLMACLLCNTS